jgi:hypothetical protein
VPVCARLRRPILSKARHSAFQAIVSDAAISSNRQIPNNPHWPQSRCSFGARPDLRNAQAHFGCPGACVALYGGFPPGIHSRLSFMSDNLGLGRQLPVSCAGQQRAVCASRSNETESRPPTSFGDNDRLGDRVFCDS